MPNKYDRTTFRGLVELYGRWAVLSAQAAHQRMYGRELPDTYAEQWFNRNHNAGPDNTVTVGFVRAVKVRARLRSP